MFIFFSLLLTLINVITFLSQTSLCYIWNIEVSNLMGLSHQQQKGKTSNL